MIKRDPNNNERFVIVGGGPAGLSAAETLRQSGFSGEIMVLSNEANLPYDTTTLTKAVMTAQHEKIVIRKDEFLKENDIDYHLNSEISSINRDGKEIHVKGSTEGIKYHKL